VKATPLFPLAFSTLGCPSYDVDQVIALARANGFSGVEIRHLRGTADLPSLPELQPARIKETRRRFDDAGIEVIGIDTSVRMSSLDPEVRRQQLAMARANLAIAQGLGARYFRVFGGPIPPAQDRERTLDAIARGLGEVADLTSAGGVTSLLETHDDFSTSPSIQDLHARGASEKLGVLWDTLHTWRHGESAEYTWEQLGGRIHHVHVKDSRKATAGGFDFALTGEGSVPIGSFLEVLKKAGYPGYVSFEWEKAWHPEIPEPEIAIPHFARFMASLA
jgi:sugar phosphate isomerase/epimerase